MGAGAGGRGEAGGREALRIQMQIPEQSARAQREVSRACFGDTEERPQILHEGDR